MRDLRGLSLRRGRLRRWRTEACGRLDFFRLDGDGERLIELHCDDKRDALEAWDEVECSFLRYWFEALGSVGADDQRSGRFSDSDCFGVG